MTNRMKNIYSAISIIFRILYVLTAIFAFVILFSISRQVFYHSSIGIDSFTARSLSRYIGGFQYLFLFFIIMSITCVFFKNRKFVVLITTAFLILSLLCVAYFHKQYYIDKKIYFSRSEYINSMQHGDKSYDVLPWWKFILKSNMEEIGVKDEPND